MSKQWVKTRYNMVFSDAQITSLWNNNGMSSVRQTNSNRNEQGHAFKKSMNPSIKQIGHSFFKVRSLNTDWV